MASFASIHAYNKVKATILSCRTMEQIHSANIMIDLFKKAFPEEIEPLFNLGNNIMKRMRVITDYVGCLEGDEVYVLGNENEPAFEAIVVRFEDWGKQHQSFLPIVKSKEDNKEYLSMGILLPKSIYNDENFLKTLNGMDYKERWNKYSKGIYKME